jgi:hypothetical protein
MDVEVNELAMSGMVVGMILRYEAFAKHILLHRKIIS